MIYLKTVIIFVYLFSWVSSQAYATPSLREAFAISKPWLRALHYSDFESRVDSKSFFLASASDPKAELEASIKAIEHNKKIHGRHFACAFPFRFHLIKKANLISSEKPKCDELEYFINEFGTDGLELVFVSQYADDPSSILGHLFFRFRNKRRTAAGSTVDYLYKTINFAAGVDPDINMFSYVYNGILGGFQGKYTIYQYATMVEKYNNIESRNLFLYDLKLNAQQIELLIKHIWELTHYSSQDYFFFDENCAFQLLAILETILPKQNLTSQLPFYVAPIDVIKVAEKNGLVASVDYVPSLYQQILDSLASMSLEEKAEYHGFMDGSVAAKDINSVLVLETLIASYNFMKHEQSGKMDEKQKSAMSQLLLARSQKGLAAPRSVESHTSAPHLSHDASRFALGIGFEDQNEYAELSFRPAIHDLLSRSEGYQRNSSISLLNFSLKLQATTPSARLSKVTLVNLAKLNGTKIYRRVAWYVDLSLVNKSDTCLSCLQPDFDISFGYSTDVLTGKLDIFTLVTSIFKENELGTYWGFGIGPTAGVIWTPHSAFRLFSKATASLHSEGKTLYQMDLGISADLQESIDLRLTATQDYISDASQSNSIKLEMGHSF